MSFKTLFRGEIDFHYQLLTDLVDGLTGKNTGSAHFNSYKEIIIFRGRKEKLTISTVSLPC